MSLDVDFFLPFETRRRRQQRRRRGRRRERCSCKTLLALLSRGPNNNTSFKERARFCAACLFCVLTQSKVMRKILKLSYFFPWYFFECFFVLLFTTYIQCTFFPKALNLLYYASKGGAPRRRWRRTCDTRRLSRKTRTNRRNRRILCLFGCRGRNKRIGNRWTRRAAGGGIDD